MLLACFISENILAVCASASSLYSCCNGKMSQLQTFTLVLLNVDGFYTPFFCDCKLSLCHFCPFSCIFPAFLFQFLSKSTVSRTMIATVFPEFLVLIGWVIQILSHNRKAFRETLPNFMFISHPAS